MLDEHTYTHRARRVLEFVGLGPGAPRAESRVVASFLPRTRPEPSAESSTRSSRSIRAIDVVVVDDASTDGTAAVARRHGATVLALPFNVGIGGAVQTGFRYARDEGYPLAVRLDGDGQHDAAELGTLIAPIRAGEVDLVDRFALRRPERAYKPPFARRMGIRVFARLVSLLGGQKVTDTTSGFSALNRAGIELFARRVSARLPRGRGDGASP